MSNSKAVEGTASSGPLTRTSGVMPSNESGLKAVTRLTDGTQAVPQLALRIKGAAQALGISVESFERHVEPHLKLLRLGTMKLVPTRELQRFIDENACRIGGDW
jgi:hypothetical protein